MFDPVTLARAVDKRVCCLPEGSDPARLFGVRLRADDDFVLLPFWSGVARDIPEWLSPPAGVDAIALETGGWVAPMADVDDETLRPSRHPQRRRIHQTVLIHGEGEDVSVLRYVDSDDEPVVLEGAVGAVADLLVKCWSRRAA